MTKEFLEIRDLSEFLRIKRATLYAKVKAGEIPYYKFGRLIRFKRNDIEAWTETNRVKEVISKGKTKRALKSVSKPKTDIDRIIKNAIDESKVLKYNPGLGNQVESSTQRGDEHGLV